MRAPALSTALSTALGLRTPVTQLVGAGVGAHRLLGVLDRRLADSEWLAGPDYSIADIATAPWVRTIRVNYDAAAETGLDGFENVTRWQAAFLARPAVQRGLTVCAAPE